MPGFTDCHSIVDSDGDVVAQFCHLWSGVGQSRWIGEILADPVGGRHVVALDVDQLGQLARFLTTQYDRAITEELEVFNDLRRRWDLPIDPSEDDGP